MTSFEGQLRENITLGFLKDNKIIVFTDKELKIIKQDCSVVTEIPFTGSDAECFDYGGLKGHID